MTCHKGQKLQDQTTEECLYRSPYVLVLVNCCQRPKMGFLSSPFGGFPHETGIQAGGTNVLVAGKATWTPEKVGVRGLALYLKLLA